jgi:hypothetical protein
MDPLKMSSKDRFDSCMKLADFYSQKVYNRQAYQWKVSIGLWTVLLVGTGFLYTNKVHIQTWVYWVIPLTYAFVWVRAIAFKNFMDQHGAHHFRQQAQALLLSEAHTVGDPPPSRSIVVWLRWCFQFVLAWAHQFEVITTVLIVLVAKSILP